MSYPDNVHPITDQPRSGSAGKAWGGGEIPQGLQVLADVEYLRIKQKIEWCEVCCGCETSNKYKIQTASGQLMFTAKEDSGCCVRNCCSARRPFDMRLYDANDREIMRLDRPYRCQSCLCPCCLQKLRVYCPPEENDNNLIGTVEQQWTCRVLEFSVLDSQGNKIMDVEGPCCTCHCCCGCCGNVGFEIRQDGQEIGRICKEWSNIGKEMVTDADTFYVTFPRHLDVKAKATLLACVILIDFMFFEKANNDTEVDAPGMIDG